MEDISTCWNELHERYEAGIRPTSQRSYSTRAWFARSRSKRQTQRQKLDSTSFYAALRFLYGNTIHSPLRPLLRKTISPFTYVCKETSPRNLDEFSGVMLIRRVQPQRKGRNLLMSCPLVLIPPIAKVPTLLSGAFSLESLLTVPLAPPRRMSSSTRSRCWLVLELVLPPLLL